MDDEERRLQVASFRYRVIADAAEAAEGDVTDAIEQAAARVYVDSTGSERRVSERTLWRWLSAYRKGRLSALMPQPRDDRGKLRAFKPELLDKAAQLRSGKHSKRPTKTIIDILVRLEKVERGQLARSTLDRHLTRIGMSRLQLGGLGETTYRKILTEAPFELVVADFHHGPYVRVGDEDKARRALLLCFIDHFSRYIVEGRYYLHEDFAALRFGFRIVLVAYGLFVRLYVDNGPSFQSRRFHAACSNEAIDIELVHSKPYVSEGRGVCERFNRTCKDQFESEVRARDELITLDELNAYFDAWLAERYHRDIHSETGQSPAERFGSVPARLRPPPESSLIDELLRLRKQRTVHRKWSTVQHDRIRYLVKPSLRGRKVHVLYDPFDRSYVLIELGGRVIERASPHKPGVQPPPLPPAEARAGADNDYLQLLRADHEARVRAELSSLRLQPQIQAELSLVELVAQLERCRGAVLSDAERSQVSACFRKMRPLEPDAARATLDGVLRRQGHGLHVRVYLDALQTQLVRQRTKTNKGKKRR